jgi:hypothetical protein
MAQILGVKPLIKAIAGQQLLYFALPRNSSRGLNQYRLLEATITIAAVQNLPFSHNLEPLQTFTAAVCVVP